MVRNLTVRLDDETVKKMEKYREVNWSEVAREAIKNYISNRESIRRHDAAIKAHARRGTYDKER